MSATPGYPKGWFCVGMSREVQSGGEPLGMTYFGRRLVMYRGQESGRVVVLDAHCPHLGADLSVGGKIQGDTITCPFHAWRFGADGQCVEVPYAKRIPPRNACVGSWQVQERNGMIFLWHDPSGGAPYFEIPVIAEYGAEGWTDWTNNLLTIKTHPREIVENVADKGHFPKVHGTHVDTFENEFTEHRAIQRTSGVAYPRGGGKDVFKLVATYHGPAYQLTEMESFMPNKLFNAHTPIDEHSLHLRFGVMLKVSGNEAKVKAFSDGYINNLQVGFAEDIAIWENKCWRDKPLLCDGDGPIGALRKWYSQFYDTPRPESLPVVQ